MRDLKTERIGRLSRFSATVTRTSDVRPELLRGHFRCLLCDTEAAGVEQQFRYTTVPPPTRC